MHPAIYKEKIYSKLIAAVTASVTVAMYIYPGSSSFPNFCPLFSI